VKSEVLIPEDLVTFLESGLSIVAATRDGDLQPDGAAALAVRVHDDRARVTVFFYQEAAAQMLRNLKSHPQIALDLDLPTTHRACQVKGLYVASRPARAAERPEIERQVEGFAADLEAIGIPRSMMAGWKTWPCTALEVRVTELFEQTPGPGTGEPLR
jgi:Pyridoxamine 5'-phosphate oxidase